MSIINENGSEDAGNFNSGNGPEKKPRSEPVGREMTDVAGSAGNGGRICPPGGEPVLPKTPRLYPESVRGHMGENPLELVDAEAWDEPVNGVDLLNGLEAVVKRFVILPEHAAEALALWIVHTYAFKLRDVSTYLGLESPEKRCGKTTLLSVLAEVVRRPVVAANISSPAFFRVIQQTEPTLLIDEADTFLQGNDELRGILNSGYTRKTAYVVRVTNQFSDEGYRKFSCWCPKVVAAIGRLPDTLADRCIVIRMQRKTRHEECERLRGFDGSEYRRKCVRWVGENEERIAMARPEWPASLNDRAADIWEPLLVLADLAGGDWPEKARKAAEFLTRRSGESNPLASLLLDLFIIFGGSGKDRLFTRDVISRLNACEGRSWSEARRGKPVNELWLAQQLRPYGVKSQNIRIDGVQAKGFLMEDMMEVFRRYLPKGDVEAFLNAELKTETAKETCSTTDGASAAEPQPKRR